MSFRSKLAIALIALSLHAETVRYYVVLLRPYPAEEMNAWRVSSDVGNVRNNSPGLIVPL